MKIEDARLLDRCEEDHSAGKGYNSMTQYNLVHKFISMPQAFKKKQMQMRQCRKDGKHWRNTSMAADESQKQEVNDEARKNSREVYYSSLMDLCHLKNWELEPQFQKYQGRAVLRGDIAKDDSGACRSFQ